MARGNNFIEREVFEELLSEVSRIDGTPYQDKRTPYNDMSRLVVGWIARSSPEELQQLHTDLGWGSSANVRQMRLAAKRWLAKNHPGRFPYAETE